MQAKQRWIWVLIVTMGLVGAAVVMVLRSEGAEAETQPIQFSHALHTKNHVTCSVCHPNTQTTAEAGIPGVLTCQKCHEDVIQVGPEEAKIAKYLEANREIPWKQVYRVPSNVYFSHRRHVVMAEIACETCHGDVASRVTPLEKPLVSIKMRKCISCHRKRQDETAIDNVYACTRCHR